MRRLTMRWWMLVALLSAALAFAACDDEATNDTDTQGPDLGEQDTVGNPDVVTNVSYLEFINPAPGQPAKLVYGSDTTLEVAFYTPDGDPIPGAVLNFEITSATNGCHEANPACARLETFSTQTGPDGKATFKVYSGNIDADAMVAVSASGYEGVQSVESLVQVRAKESYDLTVQFVYEGSRVVTSVKPRLFREAACTPDVFTPPLRNVSDPNGDGYQQLPTVERSIPDIERQPDGTFLPAVFMSLPNSSSLIAMGWAETDAGLVMIYGCSDERSADGKVITVNLEDTPIKLEGSYSLASNFDLLSGFPRRTNPDDSMMSGDWIDTIIGIFESPGETLYGLLGPYIEQIGGFDIPDGLDGVIGSLIDDAIFNFAPEGAEGYLVAGADIAEMLTSLQLMGHLVVEGEPDFRTGEIADQVHRYDTVSMRWRYACVQAGEEADNCSNSRISFSLNEIGMSQNVIEGAWSGAVVPCESDSTKTCIMINQHGMTVPYGEIALGIIEKKLLPMFVDPTVDSLELLIQKVLLGYIIQWYNNGKDPSEQVDPNGGCTSVGQALEGFASLEGVLGDAIGSIGEYACSEGVSYLVNLIDEQAANLTLESGDNLLLSTKGDCKLYDLDGNLEYDQIGDAVPETQRCEWDIQFRYKEGADPVALDGRFHAKRGGL